MTLRHKVAALEAALGDRQRSCLLIVHIGPAGKVSVPKCPHGHPLSADLRECARCSVKPSKRRRVVIRHIPADRARDRGAT